MDEKEQVKKSDTAQREEETLAYWQSANIFEKSLEQTRGGKEFVFYDGPPFATGAPHYGHILTSVIKDAIPRYQTMKGRYVRRVWGWDCHGLPVENLIEQELGLGHKKDIEEYGIEKFNEAARASVMRYDTEWKKIIPRIGRFIDMGHSYKTMDANYTESIWWAFKNLFDKGLVYKGFKAMHICPRCETTLSSNEVADGYKDVADISVTAKFELIEPNTQNLTPKTYILAWTTTPWTLPGNVALAINQESIYCKVKSPKSKVESSEFYILAKDRLQYVLKDIEYEIIDEFKGSDLVDKSYKPIFDYYSKDASLKNHENGWKIYGADFVTMESGTGVVHIAPAFGEDDMALGVKENLPFVQHVAMDGTMKKEVSDFVGLSVKPKSKEEKERLSTDIAVLKYLQDHNLYFSKEKITHAYPHCWRCDTPLLNYAADSWFVKVSALREKLLAENAKTSWVPKNMRDGRFGKWLEGARDWAISRSRFWGAPIPVWQCKSCSEIEVFGSRAELSARVKKSGNRYLVMRHGEAESNAQGMVSSKVNTNSAYGLTEDGRMSATASGEKLKGENIDIIITSPFLRTKETAEIVAGVLGFDTQKIIVDERIKEIDTGVFDGKPISEYRGHFSSVLEKFTKRPDDGENLLDVKRRAMSLMEELENKYEGKTILLVTHEYPTWMLSAGVRGATPRESAELRGDKEDFVSTGEVTEISFTPFPHNTDFEFDFHRPYIDTIKVSCSCGDMMSRVPYVFDCWFESGSMPYAQFHYPFENKELFEKNFPADFIGEGVDQTRGWFYSMLVLSVGLFGREPFQNVIVNGLVLAEDGQKMSKRLKNYPDIWDILNKYGADAVRYYLLSSPIVHAEDLAFSERGVDEVVKKNIARLLNVLSFYEMYGGDVEATEEDSKNPLDQWILARLAEITKEMTQSFDAYELDRAVKPVSLFVDDLSTWYIRRSRDRFKSDNVADRAHAIETTRMVLFELSKLLAPVMPFLAEHLYAHSGGEKESVHLEMWPKSDKADDQILKNMTEVRRVVSLALEARARAGVKVRQPLNELKVKKFLWPSHESADSKLKEEYAEIIKDEINVKEVVFIETLSEDVTLDIVITPELKKEGQFRDVLRTVQGLRKTAKLNPSELITLHINTNAEGRILVEMFLEEFKKTALLRDFVFDEKTGEPIDFEGIPFGFFLEK